MVCSRQGEDDGALLDHLGGRVLSVSNSNAVFNVAIRTLALDSLHGEALYGVGGGIAADSVAHDEYAEILTKSLILQGAA